MKTKIVLAAILALSLSGCFDDGVPKVTDAKNPVDAQGNVMKPGEFLNKYCNGKITNEDCVKVEKQKNADFTRGDRPKGW